MAEIFKISAGDAPIDALSGAHIAFGVFDGIHRGHAKLIGGLPGTPARRGILTFDPDPADVLFPGKTKKLQSNERRIEMLAACGVDFVVVLDFDKAFSRLGPDEFLSAVFGQETPASIHVGDGFRFGHKASGTIDDLRAWGDRVGCMVVSTPLLEVDGERVSSTRIRKLLADGKILDANKLLGRTFSLQGCVEQGRHEGTSMGFATANLAIPKGLDALGAGVYAAYATIGGGRYKAAVSMGVSPTFEQARAACEAHILDFEGDLYGQVLELEFVAYLRPMKKFDDIDVLISTVKDNIAWVRENL